MRSRLFLVLATLAALTAGGANASDTIPVIGRVFLDMNGDGQYDPGSERGLPGVRISNGQAVVVTDSRGGFSTVVDRGVSRFVWMNVPRGRGATTPFFDRVDPTAAADTAYFGLRDDAASGSGPFTFAQTTDIEIADALQGTHLAADLAELVSAVPAPGFIVATGDLVSKGEWRYLFGYYREATAGLPITLWNGYGNHDREVGAPDVTAAFQDSLGPTYFSFDYGDAHFVMLNTMDTPPAQAGWFNADLARVAPGTRIIVLRHDPPTTAELDDYLTRGVSAVICGHWHGDRILNYRGIQVFNTPPFTFAGLDRTPHGFRLFHVTPDSITSELRWGGIRHLVTAVYPAENAPHVRGVLPVLVNAYDSASPVTDVSVTITGPTGSLPPIPLARRSEWSWAASWDASDLPAGIYHLDVTVHDATAATWTAHQQFLLLEGEGPLVAATTNWELFHGDPRHLGKAADTLSLPLALAWSAPTGGMIGLSSPVVHDGRVYVGTGRNADPSEAGVTAFDATTGARLWRQVTSGSVKNTVAATEDGVFATTVNGILHVFDPETGTLRWRIAEGDTAVRWENSSPTVTDGFVFAGRASNFSQRAVGLGSLYGEIHEGMDFVPNDYPATAVTADRFILSTPFGIFARNRLTGLSDWSLITTSLGLAVDGGVAYTVDGQPNGALWLTARDEATGAMIWRSSQNLAYSLSSPAVTDSLIVVGTGDSQVSAFDRATGALRWSFVTPDGIVSTRPYWNSGDDVVSSPVISGHRVFVGGGDGNVYALDLANGTVVWRFHLGAPIRSTPAVSGNTLFITADDGCLYAFAPQTPSSPAGGTEGPTTPPEEPRGLHLGLPSPLRAGDHIRFRGPGPGEVPGEIFLVNVRGRLVRRLYSGSIGPGTRDLVWDGRNSVGASVAPGVYFAVLRTGAGTVEKKILLVD